MKMSATHSPKTSPQIETKEKEPLVFTNSISTPNDPYETFTATGRRFNPAHAKHHSAATSMMLADSLGQGPANTSPMRFTDDCVISIPVMPHAIPTSTTFDRGTSFSSDDDDDSIAQAKQGPVQESSRRPSLFKKFSNSFSEKGGAKEKKKGVKRGKEEFVMKDVIRRDYLKYYAKDDDGNYIGTEDPADDCILRKEADIARYRGGRR